MSLLEKYKWYQTGIVKAGVTVNLQKFFKTNPTEEQLMLLDEASKMNDTIMWLIVILYLGLGVLLGYAVAQIHMLTGGL